MTHQMRFSLPPVVERELRVAARHPSTYWSRAGAATSGVAVICLVMLTQVATAPLAVVGQTTFRLLGGMATLTVLISVVQLASAAFAREKREDTLGLLFLTPLRPVDMVLGKLVSTSLSSFYRFLALVPVLAVPLLAGGVSLGSFVLLVVALLNLIFLGATLGLWISARCWDEKRAGSVASSIMIALLTLPVVVGLGTGVSRFQPGAIPLEIFSPGFAVWHAVMPGTGRVFSLSFSLLWTQVLGWIFFYAACHTLPRCWQTRPDNLAPQGDHLKSPAAETTPLQTSAGTNLPSKAADKQRTVRRHFTSEARTSLLDINPLAWFALRWKPPATGTWAIAGVAMIGYWPALMAGITADEWGLIFAPGYALAIIFLVHTAIKTFTSHQASFAFARDRGEDTLDLLLSTPVTVRQLIDGHTHGLCETLRPVIRRTLWIEGAWLAFLIVRHMARGGDDGWLYALGGAAMLGLLNPDLRALVWTTMWQSVIRKSAREAQQEAVLRVFVLPWLPVLVAWGIGAMIGGAHSGSYALVVSWILFSALADRWFQSRSQQMMEERLMLWAVRRAAGEFEHYDGWKNLGRTLGRWWASQGRQRRA